jgi:hypothetical protein
VDLVGTFLVEGYLAAGTARRLGEFGDAAARVGAELAAAGIRVTYLGGVFLPADQTCFGLFQAAERQHVSDICHRAGIPCDRVTEAVLSPRPPGAAPWPATAAPWPAEGEINETPA